MTRYLIIFLIIIITLLLTISIVASIQKGKKAPSPTSQPVLSAPKKSPGIAFPVTTPTSLSIVSVFPDNNSTNIALDQTITVTFNQKVAPDNIEFFANPTLDYSIKTNGNSLIIVPSKPLLSGITYTYQISIKDPHQSSDLYKFTTVGEKQKYLPDTQPPGMAEEIDAFNKQNHPDIFLGSKVPYKSPDFSITQGGLKPDPAPKGHYYFKVTLIGEEQIAKDALSAWLKSLGLSNTQIQGLDFEYQTQ